MFKKPDKSSAGSSGIKLPLIQKLKPPRRSTFVQTKLPKLKAKPLIEGFNLEEIERKFKIRDDIDDDNEPESTLPLIFRWDKVSTGSTASLLRSDTESSRLSLSSNSSTESLNNKSAKSKSSLKSAGKREKDTPSPLPPSQSPPLSPSTYAQDKKEEARVEPERELEVWDLVCESSEDAESIPEHIQQIEDDDEGIESEKRDNPTALSPFKPNFVLQRSYSKTDFLFYYYY